MSAETTLLSSAPTRAARRELTAALARGDLDAADRALALLPGETPRELLEPVGMLHLARGRWAEAAATLAALPQREANVEALRRYAGNLAALERHRPEVYRLLMSTPAGEGYELDHASALPTVLRRTPGGAKPIVPTGDPRRNLEQAAAHLKAFGASPIALAGVGDGHVLRHLAEHPPATPLKNEQAVFVIEPDVDLLRATLLLQDFAKSGGPIAQPRFVWSVGPRWHESLLASLAAQPQLPMPTQVLNQSTDAAVVIDRYREIAAAFEAADVALRRELEEHYAKVPAAAFAAAMRGELARPPRAVLVTSRFTTVLQHSTRDTAEALAHLGWDAHVLIEDAPHLQLTVRHIRKRLHELRPDLVIVLDHLRYEYGDLFPPNLPFACWIQDELANLTCEKAGRSITPRDFVWTPAGVTYAGRYAYPLRQCVYLEKLTRMPQRPATWAHGEDDLAFVSNASQRPEQLVGAIVALAGDRADVRELLQACCDRVLLAYRRGDHLHSYSQVRDILAEESLRLDAPPLPAETRERIVLEVFSKLNNALYRQQALGWAAAAADALGLRLSLYGSGWETHPTFARHARGPVAYGPALEEVTRRARINLQVVPYAALHQRLLDGIAAGGFFLVRSHPLDALLPELERLGRELPDGLDRLDDARRHLRGEALAALESTAKRYRVLCEHAGADPIALAKGMVRQGAGPRLCNPPRLGEVSFRDATTLRRLIARYVHDEPARRAVWREQCGYVERVMTYRGDLPRVLGLMADLLDAEAAETLRSSAREAA